MEKFLIDVREAIEPAMKEMDIIVDDVEYLLENNYNFLRITLDKVNGIDLDTIVAATNVINPIIDTFDVIDDSYILDVISKERGDVNNG